MGECWHWHSLIFTTNNLWPTFIPEYCGKFVENVPIIICIKNWFVLFFALFLDIRSYPLIVADNNHTLLEKGKHVRRYWKKSPGPTFIGSRSENLKKVCFNDLKSRSRLNVKSSFISEGMNSFKFIMKIRFFYCEKQMCSAH